MSTDIANDLLLGSCSLAQTISASHVKLASFLDFNFLSV